MLLRFSDLYKSSFLSKTGKYYKLLDGPYVEFDEADKKCKDLGARLPVLDSQAKLYIPSTLNTDLCEP